MKKKEKKQTGVKWMDELPLSKISQIKVFYDKAPYDSLRQKGEILRKHFKESNNEKN